MTGTELIGPGVSLAKLLFDVAKSGGGSIFQAVGDQAKAAAALKKYADKYTDRYGAIRLLGMRQGMPLELIYTKVKFLDDLSIRQFLSLETLEQTYRKTAKRRFQIQEPARLDAPKVVDDHQFLMVLGGPGAGKSTFLRRTGLEALKGEKGVFKHRCIPVMLELKRFNVDAVDLVKAISEELANFGFPEADKFAINLLEQGKLLILLDGLDEVPTANLNTVINEIQNFVTKYDKNRYIASCRIAAHRSTWNRFRDIELADFDDEQIQRFIQNWFHADLDILTKTADKCWETLNDSSNDAAKELAQTPLLLTFLCMVYDRTQGFPTNRATLYRKALDILLEEWAAEKRIQQSEIYKGLNPDLEKVLLAEIAYNSFVNDQLFFTQQELVEQIKAFLADTVDKPKYLDGKAVLDAITIQQGILVARAEGIFSFSHLTLHEYLAAYHVAQQPDLMQALVEQHLTDDRWREVFLLVAGCLRNANSLLEPMAAKAPTLLTTEKLKALVNWVDRSTAGSPGDYKPAAKRVAALFFSLSLDLSFSLFLSLTLSRSLSLHLSLPLPLDFDLSPGLDLSPALTLSCSLLRCLEFERIKIFKQVDFTGLIDRLEGLKARIPEGGPSKEIYQKFVKQLVQIWCAALHLQPEWLELSKQEAESLEKYLSANLLMVQCKEAAVRVSRETWAGIEQRMLTVEDGERDNG
ncbi:NACHT domain-containing protein [Phormidium sp. CLA17]|uniref:NACHT domain-containing protein n=1 Tax=Leptolyngbya sp. Cla-17 TaxID=2803751 RepID=UPI0014915896|nr:NACHT domain-containing protein [Leptolyngbya sp. Cla-17]MBM0740527.1 NACHT domain-containing protein [Leptolyngbya sp. Cla-17]